MLYDSPVATPQRALQTDTDQPFAAMALDGPEDGTVAPSPGENAPMQDVDMHDAGPSANSMPGCNKTFFHDD